MDSKESDGMTSSMSFCKKDSSEWKIESGKSGIGFASGWSVGVSVSMIVFWRSESEFEFMDFDFDFDLDVDVDLDVDLVFNLDWEDNASCFIWWNI